MDNPISQALRERILVLDGGFGTMLQSYDIDDLISKSPTQKKGCNDLLSVTHPDIVADIHRRYLEAGADIITTNSFNANAISLSDYGLQDRAYEIARAAAQVARSQADKYSTDARRRYVAGSVGPTNRTLSMSADVNTPETREVDFDQMYQAYSDQVRGLIDGGVDLILVETIFDTLNAKAALKAIRDIDPEIPIMISATVSDASGRLLTGQTIEAFYTSVAHAKPLTVGLNCGFGAKHLLPHLRRLAAAAQCGVSVHPNAGLPNVMGEYDETPEMMVDDIRAYLQEGLVNIVGGCCGTTPAHIQKIAEIVDGYKPHEIKGDDGICRLSGLEPLEVRSESNFINVGERTNVAGSAKFAKLIREGHYDEALAIAKAQVEAGAQIVDVCMDDAMIDAPGAMTRFLNLMASEPEVARVPVMIDSSKFQVIEAGLKCTQGKSIVNSISLKEGEKPFLDHARTILRYGAAAVVMLFDENGQADTYQRKIDVAARAYKLLTDIGFPPQDIIFDPNILAVATGIAEHDRFARDFIDATRWIKQNLPHAKVSGGVSNLSFAFRGNNQVRKAMHAIFLYHAIKAGMDMAIVNPQMVQLYDDIEPTLLGAVEDVVLYRREDAADRLIELANNLVAVDTKTDNAQTQQQWRNQHYAKRIEYAMVKGDTEYIAEDTMEAYHDLGNAVEVINQVLMPAMTHVGELFADGKMFLPQVVKSARVMKQAVAVIQPYINKGENADSDRASKPIVIATVKGDVHDIGKNIVAVVLACNGYDVHDLGVMTPPERIIDEAIRLNAKAICLSGLITPSLEEMIHVAEEAERRGLNIPIVVGGATTSSLHTAVKIAPVTKAPVIHSTDAADNARVMGHLFGSDRDQYLQKNAEKQQEERTGFDKPVGTATMPTTKTHTHAVGCPCCQPKSDATVQTPTIDDVEDAINWSFFFSSWGMPGRFPDILDDAAKGTEARKLYDDAREMLGRMAETEAVKLIAISKTYRAKAEGDDIVLDSGQRIAMLRARDGQCVSDFVGSGGEVTLFTLSAGIGTAALCEKYRNEGDEYSAIMVKLLSDRLVEAMADKLLPGGCRIAFGYPSAPDHTLKRDVFTALGVESVSPLRLTESYMINPPESICGIYLKDGHFIDASDVDRDALAEYAQRRALPIEVILRSFPNIS